MWGVHKHLLGLVPFTRDQQRPLGKSVRQPFMKRSSNHKTFSHLVPFSYTKIIVKFSRFPRTHCKKADNHKFHKFYKLHFQLPIFFFVGRKGFKNTLEDGLTMHLRLKVYLVVLRSWKCRWFMFAHICGSH